MGRITPPFKISLVITSGQVKFLSPPAVCLFISSKNHTFKSRIKLNPFTIEKSFVCRNVRSLQLNKLTVVAQWYSVRLGIEGPLVAGSREVPMCCVLEQYT